MQDAGADIALCTADRLSDADDAVGAGEVAVLSLDPFGKPAADLPVGRHRLRDSGPGARRPDIAGTPTGARAGRPIGGRSARRRPSLGCRTGFHAGDRVMSTAGWTTADELTDNLLAVFAAGASLVQVANPDPAALDRRRETEKVTRG